MEIDQLDELFSGSRKQAVTSALKDKKTSILSFYGLAGSSVAMMLASLPKTKSPSLVIADSQDDAGYIYHDLTMLLDDEQVLMLPSEIGRASCRERVLRDV